MSDKTDAEVIVHDIRHRTRVLKKFAWRESSACVCGRWSEHIRHTLWVLSSNHIRSIWNEVDDVPPLCKEMYAY